MRARESSNRILPWVLVVVAVVAGGAITGSPVAGKTKAPALWQGLQPGPHAVGFATVYLFDDTRAFGHPAGEDAVYQGRPLRLMIWYPGRPTAKAGMPFSAYSSVRPGDDRFAAVNDMLVERDVDTAPRLAFTPPDIEIQARDVEYALAALVRAANVDAGRTALLGHSSGGLVALLVASRNANVDAIVSLEGSISTADGAEILGGMQWSPESVLAPVLNLYADGKQGLDLAVLDLLSGADRYHGAFGSGAPPGQATHFDFQNWPLYALLTGTDDPRGLHFRNAETGKDFYLAACRLTREFLDATLKDDPAWRDRFAAATEVEIESGLGRLSHQTANVDSGAVN